ncbi:site-specific integrase [Tsuneonella mangrovi]|uniref:site-specific integrase n=1 Tax=Tsuneonella mangrovi TaxID=1982042 RepID=UPI000BA20F60|nr:site-specific integrase [Tsuneonella mangrovi]
MASLQNRHNKWRAKVRIPKSLRDHHGGQEFLQKTLSALDKPTARAEAETWEAGLRSEWAALASPSSTSGAALRRVYDDGRRAALMGEYTLIADTDDDPVELGIDREIEKIAEQAERDRLTEAAEARLAGLQDALKELQGQKVKPRRELEPTFSELAKQHVELWATQDGLKESNTRQQKEATFRLFAGYCKDRPIRSVTRAEVAGFMDALRRLDPLWSRSPKSRTMTWSELQNTYWGNDKGLSASTLNRHATTLQGLWWWAEARGHCEGRNPFTGLHQKIRPGKNLLGYLPWTTEELRSLFNPPPRRTDITEVMVVALHTGMRLNEIASLTLGDIREAEGVTYIEVQDAKTPAGNRQVPLHPRIAWLGNLKGPSDARVWPGFNGEGPGKKPGQDASKEFSRFKVARGFTDRRKVFHSFRKNVTKIIERAGVPENEWAQVLGHERGFTYKTYNADGITMQRKAELIALIEYPGLEFPGR